MKKMQQRKQYGRRICKILVPGDWVKSCSSMIFFLFLFLLVFDSNICVVVADLYVLAQLCLAPQQRMIKQVEVLGCEQALQVNLFTCIGDVYLAVG